MAINGSKPSDMKIAFYSPLKSPDHPVPSGDRLMARLLIDALARAGHEVAVASHLRSFTAGPDGEGRAAIEQAAGAEVERLSALWQAAGGAPDAWFCYHPYYKAPDLIGPELARRFGLAYVTAEASYSNRRNQGLWAENQQRLAQTIGQAAVNICLTRRDRDGLAAAIPDGRYALLQPFIDPSPFVAADPAPKRHALVAVAMMRPGDKMESYRMLAAALARLRHLPWTLAVAGDGALRGEVEALFSAMEGGRIAWHGERGTAEIAAILGASAVYAWPGTGEAYGLAYLEAQAAGLPVVAQATAGVPEVVRHGVTGLLTPPGDVDAYAAALERMLTDDAMRQDMAVAARRFVIEECSLERAARRLDEILRRYVRGRP
ncbi:glycosyltransferase involved in cell wall biosynthesis [Rhizobium azooxidifex]|uniref:Glycosyltransferase involved in cell wall biosynthesis n=2 Tax=Mycoplana azooxidifex TaxID=1636188 RepID=A0A7W6GID9_9HYPH|nr:glycosyltransferase involved in cell wall biosynthesis [Mycoplana azooxidifex]